jgi:hypothetical protein
MDDDILEQLLRDDANFATVDGHRIVEIDTFAVHLAFSRAYQFAYTRQDSREPRFSERPQRQKSSETVIPEDWVVRGKPPDTLTERQILDWVQEVKCIFHQHKL